MRTLMLVLGGLIAGLWIAACAIPGADRVDMLPRIQRRYEPMAMAATLKGFRRPDTDTGRMVLSVPMHYRARVITPASGSPDPKALTDQNWSWTVKQRGRVQAYVVQTPDFFEVIEQELPRHQQDFDTLPAALAYANQRYPDWPIVSIEP